MTTRRVFGAVLVFVAAGLAVAATFLVAFSVETQFANRRLRFEATTWGVEHDDFRGSLMLAPIDYGWPAIVAAGVMAVSAVVAFRQPVARLGSLLGAGVLVGLAWLSLNQVQQAVEQLEELNVPVPLEVVRGNGVTVLLVAAGVGVVAALLHQELSWQRPVERTGGVVIHQIEGNDEETPPYGFPVVVEPKNG
ncbi:hypothetical protein BBK82_24695 [Lentzea guizhouensis]|uniref:Uncharacterized protein n=1 Tax=Lentzea guizhouensis TaxID=1586287 RepID=A0A1B2HM32_9PSEU|nr:hypothetical protein [Lentzea guizhouensis]ANZ38784.1 hypothetical protein BBK82_24695 [Lentzea guizhouensis]